MFPLIGGLISGGASLLGNIFSSNTSASNTQAQIAGQEAMQAQSENFNAEQAQLNRDFQASQVSQQEGYQTQMSNTAYQRASADMKAAGLNPAMMFGSGGAASSPSGSSASGSTASVGTPSVPMPQNKSPLGNLGDVVTSALSTAAAVKGFEKQQADIDLLRSQKHNVDENALNTSVDTVNKGTENDLIQANVASRKMDNLIKSVGATTARNVESIDPTVRKTLDIGAFGADKASKIEDAAGGLISSALGVKKLLSRGSASSYRRGYDAGSSASFEDRFNAVGE